MDLRNHSLAASRTSRGRFGWATLNEVFGFINDGHSDSRALNTLNR